MATHIFGVDLAWGERQPDGVCWLRSEAAKPPAPVTAVETALVHGDHALADWLAERTGPRERAMVMADAPLVIPNRTGARPVDKLTHRLFRRQHAGCHPAFLDKCPRPPRVRRLLETHGYHTGWQLNRRRLLAEVYPHPAMVRLFGLPQIIKYKRGRVEEKRREFRRLQRLLRLFLREHAASVTLSPSLERLLREPWSKRTEDRTDAFFCALIGWWHWHHRGRLTEILGDREKGFILVPRLEA